MLGGLRPPWPPSNTAPDWLKDLIQNSYSRSYNFYFFSDNSGDIKTRVRQVLEQKTTLAAASGVLIIMAICGLVCLMGKTCHEEKRKKKNSMSPRTHSVKSTPSVSTTSITTLSENSL